VDGRLDVQAWGTVWIRLMSALGGASCGGAGGMSFFCGWEAFEVDEKSIFRER